jgi:hypothetical protein
MIEIKILKLLACTQLIESHTILLMTWDLNHLAKKPIIQLFLFTKHYLARTPNDFQRSWQPISHSLLDLSMCRLETQNLDHIFVRKHDKKIF